MPVNRAARTVLLPFHGTGMPIERSTHARRGRGEREREREREREKEEGERRRFIGEERSGTGSRDRRVPCQI